MPSSNKERKVDITKQPATNTSHNRSNALTDSVSTIVIVETGQTIDHVVSEVSASAVNSNDTAKIVCCFAVTSDTTGTEVSSTVTSQNSSSAESSSLPANENLLVGNSLLANTPLIPSTSGQSGELP